MGNSLSLYVQEVVAYFLWRLSYMTFLLPSDAFGRMNGSTENFLNRERARSIGLYIGMKNYSIRINWLGFGYPMINYKNN